MKNDVFNGLLPPKYIHICTSHTRHPPQPFTHGNPQAEKVTKEQRAGLTEILKTKSEREKVLQATATLQRNVAQQQRLVQQQAHVQREQDVAERQRHEEWMQQEVRQQVTAQVGLIQEQTAVQLEALQQKVTKGGGAVCEGIGW